MLRPNRRLLIPDVVIEGRLRSLAEIVGRHEELTP